jgi:pimeloyl-ACP methyl ester carboxylesterase
MSATTTRRINGPGDRTLLVHEAGDPDGALVVYHHGTPQNGLMLESWKDHAAAKRLRLVSYDRPGYGGSTPQPGRLVADAAGDVAAIADALGAERFATFGASGGAPHALGCASLLDDRVAAVAAVGTVAPFAAEGLNFFAGMGRDNWVEFGAALVGRATLEPILVAEVRARAAETADSIADGLRTLISEADQKVLDGGLADWLHATMLQGTAPGTDGWVDDDLAFAEPWGFDLGDIAVPVLVMHGRQDRFVPVSHGEWVAGAIPGAEERIHDADGHLTLIAHRVPGVLDWLHARLV